MSIDFIIFCCWLVSSLVVVIIPKDFQRSMFVGRLVRYYGPLAFTKSGCEHIKKAEDDFNKNYWKNNLFGCLMMFFIMLIFDLILRTAIKM